MLHLVNRRAPFLRFLAVGWATLQLASPGLIAIADGISASASFAEAASHVEATGSESCPVPHSPDCAVCRYLSSGAAPPPHAALLIVNSTDLREPRADSRLRWNAAVVLPDGRAPPIART